MASFSPAATLHELRRIAKRLYDRHRPIWWQWEKSDFYPDLESFAPAERLVLVAKSSSDEILSGARLCQERGLRHFHFRFEKAALRDLARVERNLRWAAEYCFQNGIAVSTEPGVRELEEMATYRWFAKLESA